MPEIKDVKPDSSAGGVKVESPPTDELVKTKGDNERLKGALSSLQSERDEMKARLERLEDIEQRYGELNARQEAEKKRLMSGQGDIDAEIDELRTKKEARAWFEQQRRELEKTKNEAATTGKMEALRELASDFIEEKVEEHSTKDSPLEVKEFIKQLKPYSMDYVDKNPFRMVQLAYRDWKKANEAKAKAAESARKEAEGNASLEGNGRQARESTAGELLNKNGNLEPNERAALREKLGIMNRPR